MFVDGVKGGGHQFQKTVICCSTYYQASGKILKKIRNSFSFEGE